MSLIFYALGLYLLIMGFDLTFWDSLMVGGGTFLILWGAALDD